MKQDLPFNSSSAQHIIHIGCKLGYLATAPTSTLFLLQPYPDTRNTLLSESFLSSSDAAFAHLSDSHGNRVIKTMLVAGYNEFHYEASLIIRSEEPGYVGCTERLDELPMEVLRYTFPSRYCESDKLYELAQERFAGIAPGLHRAQAICDWVHHRLEYRYGSGHSSISACDALARGYGVCRDFAHVMIALCRAMDIPARYVAGHVPPLKANAMETDNDIGIDFHAYVEVYAGGRWHTFDPRYNRDFAGRVKIAHGMDAVDAAFATFYGSVQSTLFNVWARPIEYALTSEEGAPANYTG